MKGYERDVYGNIINQWGKFDPIKMIRGTWSTEKKVIFSKELGPPLLVLNRLYVIHANDNGEYIVPCYWFGSLQSFNSIKDERFIRFEKFLSNP
ncbi:hypothetical protein [Pleionea mediterranea]|uniref:Uncharacterized protein n=1 Tax=Pleionea mediterranea TaxID=523701 RepID=A0A316FW70_9GAMM|nr:hypothetical protein [Pleionea mediterranea]PWK53044.1 hypothetical protein C8D97_104262 [Pleionea mediterranea]